MFKEKSETNRISDYVNKKGQGNLFGVFSSPDKLKNQEWTSNWREDGTRLSLSSVLTGKKLKRHKSSN